MRLKKYIEKYANNVNPEMFALSQSIDIELGDVLDALHLHLDCCRTRMLTQLEYTSVY